MKRDCPYHDLLEKIQLAVDQQLILVNEEEIKKTKREVLLEKVSLVFVFAFAFLFCSGVICAAIYFFYELVCHMIG